MRHLLVLLLLMTQAFSPVNAGDAKAVGTLETNSHRVLIGIKESKPVYTVQDLQGQVLARELSREELFSAFPNLKTLVKGGIAQDASLERGNNKTILLKRDD